MSSDIRGRNQAWPVRCLFGKIIKPLYMMRLRDMSPFPVILAAGRTVPDGCYIDQHDG